MRYIGRQIFTNANLPCPVTTTIVRFSETCKIEKSVDYFYISTLRKQRNVEKTFEIIIDSVNRYND